jgi:hypothetical protein
MPQTAKIKSLPAAFPTSAGAPTPAVTGSATAPPSKLVSLLHEGADPGLSGRATRDMGSDLHRLLTPCLSPD